MYFEYVSRKGCPRFVFAANFTIEDNILRPAVDETGIAVCDDFSSIVQQVLHVDCSMIYIYICVARKQKTQHQYREY